ncbi:VOC family protein [Shewanella sp. C32]|uniref:VOC family protein n=1 Tax=Shewanella electrica TaxID=515560 RepID=A0ABT2FJ35_9GAMM|nr:VOC family protein [Shewanella electrica]MCS4556338.1 VOC family protein [Shewanella electrica]
MQIDHLVIFCSPGAQEVELLNAFGLHDGAARSHTGQGTASRCFFFGNCYLELLFVEDEVALRSAATRVTRLAERFLQSNSNTSPFGVCFKQPDAALATLAYHPEFLPQGYRLTLARHNPLSEPLWFFLQTPDGELPPFQRQTFNWQSELHQLTAVNMTIAEGSNLSPTAKAVMAHSCIELFADITPLMELTFDHGAQRQSHDFRPALPLLLRW